MKVVGTDFAVNKFVFARRDTTSIPLKLTNYNTYSTLSICIIYTNTHFEFSYQSWAPWA